MELHTAVDRKHLIRGNSYLNNISLGAPKFRVHAAGDATMGVPQLAVGHGAAVILGVQPALLADLGNEGLFVSTNVSKGVPAGSVVLTGAYGAPATPAKDDERLLTLRKHADLDARQVLAI